MRSYHLCALAIAVLSVSAIKQARAYEMATHFDLANAAVLKSRLGTDPELLTMLGLPGEPYRFASPPGEDAPDFTDECRHGAAFAIPKLIACGAQFEDHPGMRALSHFYDPVRDRALTIGGKSLGSRSPDWAVEESDYSYAVARSAFYSALTTTGGRVGRDGHWGRMFQALGQVIHHLQDMAQPQHVRNDAHLDRAYVPYFHNPSLYEKYTLKQRIDLRPLMESASAAPVFTNTMRGLFKTPRDFWRNGGETGIAQFTNRNFVSAGTNFDILDDTQVSVTEYALPNPGGMSGTIDAREIDPPLSPEVMAFCAEKSSSCSLSFYATQGDIANARASTLSIFDQYIARRQIRYGSADDNGSVEYAVDRVFSLNRYNFEAAYPHLLPRAVSYSAGLINYFFRGQLRIGLPEEGVYAAVDHLTPLGNVRDTGGFGKIKVTVQNVTAAGFDAMGRPLIEPMPQGHGYFVAVVKFHRNGCYMPDLSREYGSLASDGTELAPWTRCRSFDESIVVSEPVLTPADMDVGPQPLTFHFADRIPINASDVVLQIVYRGQLGSENDAVIVATKDISEPSYIYSLPESYDQFTRAAYPSFEPGDYGWEEWCAQGGMTLEQCNDDYGNRRKWRFTPNEYYDPANYSGESRPISDEAPFDPVLSAPAHVGKYGRAAVLTDLERPEGSPYPDITGPYYLYLRLSESGITAPETFNWNWGGFRVTENQLDPVTGTLTPSVTYQQARGVFLYSGDHLHYLKGTAPNVPPLEPVPTTINFPD